MKHRLPILWITLIALTSPLGGRAAERPNILYTSHRNGVPTFMDMAGLVAPADMLGQSLVPPPGVDGQPAARRKK